MAIKQGDKVKVDYKGTFDDGTVFDTSEGKAPIEFQVGSGQLIKGFDDAVIGMEKDQEKDISLEPAQAYGEPRPELMQKVPRTALPKDQEPKVGMTMVLNSPQGQIPARISEVTDNDITLDLNHPLAGKKINFHIKIVEINSA